MSTKSDFSDSVELGIGKPNVHVTLNGKCMDHQDGESVLDTLERNNVDAQYNCREGYCGVCRTTLIAGSVDYTLDPLAFIDDDEILTCCTVPSSNIQIKTSY